MWLVDDAGKVRRLQKGMFLHTSRFSSDPIGTGVISIRRALKGMKGCTRC